MDIVIGKAVGVKSKDRSDLPVKKSIKMAVRALHVRPARSRLRRKNLWRGQNRRAGEGAKESPDPVNAKVLLLLAPDGSRLPPDLLENGKYELRLTIHPKKPFEKKQPEPAGGQKKGLTQWV